jgi:ABC-type sugar transport system ATPase subunit
MGEVASTPPLVRLTGITKRFGPVTVLRDAQFECRAGEVHVLAGENGAGKSTLIKILAGIHTDFEGKLEIAVREERLRDPLHASALGIAVIHQELSLIGPMSVADNLFLARHPARAGFVCQQQQRRDARACLKPLGLEIDVDRPVQDFSPATQQLMEIAKALSQKARLFVMDEPTSALNAPEVERLFGLIQKLKQQGCGIIYISHKMEEIERIADRITVLRDGRWIGTESAANLPETKLIEWMVGREMGEQYHRRPTAPGAVRLRVDQFSVIPAGQEDSPPVKNVSFDVRSGEVLGVAGLQGSGASELLLGLFGGYGARTRGRVELDGQPAPFSSPRTAIAAGVSLLTNDRKATGLVLSLSVTANATLAGLPALSPGGWRKPAREKAAAKETTDPMRLRAPSLEAEASTLSGGNQQKVALAKSLQTRPRVLMLDEPTKGIDVGAKREIYQLMDTWTAQGIAILLITSEMPELLALSDRIVVLHRGAVTAELSRTEATPQKVLAAAMGRLAEKA